MATEAIYIDTSVMVKLYTEEPDSESCEAMVVGKTLVSSRLLYCEFQSALLGKASRGVISAAFLAEVWRAFQSDVAAHRIRFVSLDDRLVQDATDLIYELHSAVSLRTLDALHLATYLSIEAGPLFTKDLRILEAAAHLGLPLAG